MKNVRKLIKEQFEQEPAPDEDDLGEESLITKSTIICYVFLRTIITQSNLLFYRFF